MNELTITLNAKSDIPLYEQIYEYIKTDIQDGRIPYGEKLPSTRKLSVHLEVSRSTVELAYEQLLAEGYIEAEPCRGYFVCRIEELYQWKRVNVKEEEPPVKEKEEYLYDFSPWGIDLQSFPYHVWRKLSKDILLGERTELFGRGEPQGEYGLRSVIAGYLYQARGVNCTPNQIIIGAGNDYLLMLLGTVLGASHKVAFESPTYRQAYRLFENLSYEVCTVPMDKSGMDTKRLCESGADIAYVMPSHQYPLGVVMPVKRRMELLKWASEAEGRYIIEDDYDSEFRYKGKPVPALQGYDAKERVIYIGTFSKSVAPAIRISYLVLPRPLYERYREKSSFLNCTVSRVDQMIVERFIQDGYYERHLNKMRALYKGRHDTLLQALRPMLGRCKITGENAGVHLLLTFPDKTERELIEAAKALGIKVYGLSEYHVDSKEEQHTVLLGYANMEEEKIREAAALLEKIW